MAFLNGFLLSKALASLPLIASRLRKSILYLSARSVILRKKESYGEKSQPLPSLAGGRATALSIQDFLKLGAP